MNRSIVVLSLVAALRAVAASAAAHPETPRLFMNEDPWHFWQADSGEGFTPLKPGIGSTRRGLEAYIDEIARGKVTHFLMNVNGQRANFPSKVLEPIWVSLDEPERNHEDWVRTLKRLADEDLDPYQVWIDRCRVKGVKPWVSIRMNDLHSTGEPRCPNISKLWRQHPELQLDVNGGWDFSGFDYSKPAIRKRMLDFINEVLARYDIDGLELDLMRFTRYLPRGRETELAPVFTDFVRDIRKTVDASAAKRGHGIALSVRVMAYPKNSRERGLQVDVWAKEGLVDFVMPCNMWANIRFDISVDEWRKWIGDRAAVVPGADSGIMENGERRSATLEEYRRWAAAMRRNGATDLYLYNLFLHPQDGEVWNGVLSCGLDAEPKTRSWLIVNEDNDHYFKGPSELMTEKALCDYIDYTCKGKVTHFFMCPSGQRASFDSKTWEPIWAGANEPDHSGKTNNIWCVNARLLHDRGIDPYAVWTRRCRERGVSPWLSMRMNDVHFSDIANYFRNTTFCRTRKDLWINPGGKDWADTSLDYAQQEVRDYNLAHLREIADRWDVDGVELDWMRFGRHLRPGRERSDAHCLDDFVRQARRTLDEVGARRGRRLSLGVRVCRDPDLAISKMGMDVKKWAEEGLVDLVVPHSFYKTDSGIAVAKWKERIGAANPKVRVIPGIDYLASIGGKDVWMTPEMYRGVAAKFWEAGAQGIYLFNLPYLGKYRADGERFDCDVADVIFREGLDPAATDGKKRTEVEVFHDF